MMKHAIKHWQGYLQTAVFLFFFVSVTNLSGSSVEPACDCAVPSATMTDHGSNSASFSWSAVGGATEYQLWYVKKENNHSSSVISTGNTSITISGFAPGTYTVYIRTICGGSMSAGYVVVEDLLMM